MGLRMLAVCVVLVACRAHVRREPLPELEPAIAPPLAPVRARTLLLVPGERLVWEVRAGGFTVGRAELVVDGDTVKSRFATGALAGWLVAARHELVTELDRAAARPARAHEVVVIAGERERRDLALASERGVVHTLHTALGWVRAWAAPDAAPGELLVAHAGMVYRMAVARPVALVDSGVAWTRVDCRATWDGEPIAIAISLDRDRVPRRIDVATSTRRVVAELIEHTRDPVAP